MNAIDIMKYGHLWVLKHVSGLTDDQWETPNVCGIWSTKDIIAHLASFECVLEDVLGSFLGDGSTPILDQYTQTDGDRFNAIQVSQRKANSPKEVLAEYIHTQERVMELAKRIPAEKLRQAGTLPWYGMEYALDDYIVYAFYGHKREHCAQIAVFRDTLK